MTNPTTPFNWQMPQSTDLVTDLPADFETFGQAVATSMADLLGGTTGQVLSKASNTDMDFTWVTSDDANAIQNAIVDAKGDLIAASAADTPARLAVGNNGETLVADSTTSTGLRWQGSQAAAKNILINGGFDIWQRSTSSTLNNGYGSADRWYQYIGAGSGTYARESTVVPTGAQYSMKFTSSSAGTSESITQYVETANAIFFSGKTVTISGQFAASTSVPMTYVFQYSTTVDAGTGAAWTTISAASGGTATPTSTTFVTMTGTYAVPSVAQSLRLIVQPVSTIASGVVIYHGLTQIELGSVATNFTRATGTIQGELAACQRYYQRFGAKNGQTVGTNATYGFGFTTSTTGANFTIPFPVTMRTTPASIEYASITAYDATLSQYTPSAVVIVAGQSGLDAGNVQFTITGAIAARAAVIIQSATTGYLAFSAEL